LPQVNALTLHEANELLAYWADYPPTHVILSAVYLQKTAKKVTKGGALSEMQDLSMMYGIPTEKMPTVISDAVKWAEEQKKKIN
jgi:hypothetical protein